MAEPYIGEIQLFAFSFAPLYWVHCDGSLLAKNQNRALFELIGTIYGGDGVTGFRVPNFTSRVPRGQGTASNLTPRKIGAVSGSFDRARAPIANDNGKHAPEQPQPYLAVNFCIALAGDYPNPD